MSSHKFIFNFSCLHVSIACQLHEQTICHLKLDQKRLVTHTTFQDLLLKRDLYWWKETYIDEKRPILMKIETCFRSFIWWPTLPFKTFFSLYSLGMKFSDLKFWVQENTFSTKKSLKFVSCRGLDPWCEVRQNIYVKMYVTYIYMHKYNIGHNIYIHVYIDFCTYMYP